MHRLIVLFFLLLPTGTWAAPLIDAELRKLDQAMLTEDDVDRIPKLASAYLAWEAALLPDRNCRNLDDRQLEAAFHATAHILHYVADYNWYGRVYCLYAELKERGAATESFHRKMHFLLIKLRMFPEANSLRIHEGLSVRPLPEIVSENRQRQGLIHATADGDTEWVPWVPDDGLEIVAYVSLTCAHSKRAMQAIINDPRFRWMNGNIRFVVRRTSSWPSADVEAWNERNPLHPILQQAGPTGWEVLDVYETPAFHVVKDGDRLQTILGWQQDGAQLLELKGLFNAKK